MYTTEIGKDVQYAAALLDREELVGIPTETVYGLAAKATSMKAIEQVFLVKKRPLNNPLIVHVGHIDQIRQYVTHIPDTALELMHQFSPGPLTLLLPSNNTLPHLINSGGPLLAFRIPAHPVTLALLEATGFPLVAPSANVFTTISPTEPAHVWKNFEGVIPYILDGGSCAVGIESTVVGFDAHEMPVIYRKGAITAEQISKVAGEVLFMKKEAATISPGLSPLHYSPSTPLTLTERINDIHWNIDVARTGLLCFDAYNFHFPLRNQYMLSAEGNLAHAARNLYRGLHYLDELGLDRIIAQLLPETGIGIAVNDRLRRAANVAEQ